MLPDSSARTVELPVQVVNGHLQLSYGIPLPALAEGTVGRLVVEESALGNSSLLTWLGRVEETELLPTGTQLLLAVNGQRLPRELQRDTRALTLQEMGGSYNPQSRFVTVELKEALVMVLRGSKQPELKPCQCKIPALGKSADSLNHAYSLVSEIFEPWRLSRTGNVFRKTYYAQTEHIWMSLDHRRKQSSTLFEARIRFGVLCNELPSGMISTQKEPTLQPNEMLVNAFTDQPAWLANFVAKQQSRLEQIDAATLGSPHLADAVGLLQSFSSGTVQPAKSPTLPWVVADLVQAFSDTLAAPGLPKWNDIDLLDFANDILAEYVRQLGKRDGHDELSAIFLRLDPIRQRQLLEQARAILAGTR